MRCFMTAMILSMVLGSCAPPPPASPGAHLAVCFTPGQDCEDEIVAAVGEARVSVLVQAYELTSAPIAAALESDAARGVKVSILLDKSQRHGRGAKSWELAADGIPVAIDYRPAIAHNKVMVIDESLPSATVITGSFNFTRGAQDRNAENLLIVRGAPTLVKAYADNWRRRAAISEPLGSRDDQ